MPVSNKIERDISLQAEMLTDLMCIIVESTIFLLLESVWDIITHFFFLSDGCVYLREPDILRRFLPHTVPSEMKSQGFCGSIQVTPACLTWPGERADKPPHTSGFKSRMGTAA